MARLGFRTFSKIILIIAAGAVTVESSAKEEGKTLTFEDFLFDANSPDMPFKTADRDTPFHEKAGTLGVVLSYHSSSANPGYVFPIIDIAENGSPAISAAFSDSETVSGKVWVALETLDPASDTPQVIVTRYDGGGAKCCFQTAIFTKVDGSWHRVNAPYQFNDLFYRIVNMDGRLALIGLDSDAISQNAPLAMEERPAVQVLLLDGHSLTSVNLADTQD